MSANLFKNFSKDEIKGTNQLKSSDARKIKEKLIKSYPNISDVIEQIWPKKVALHASKCQNNVTLYTLNSQPIFFQERDGPIIPTLRILHQYPNILPQVQVDRGAISHVISGANIMCPGLTSAGGIIPSSLIPSEIVAVFCEGKQYASAIGKTLMSREEIIEKNKDVGVENIHYLGDGLFHILKI